MRGAVNPAVPCLPHRQLAAEALERERRHSGSDARGEFTVLGHVGFIG